MTRQRRSCSVTPIFENWRVGPPVIGCMLIRRLSSVQTGISMQAITVFIWDSREANIIAITDRKTGNITWRLGPAYDGSEAERKLGWIIGQHHAHIIPRGLPGEGNLLVFDNSFVLAVAWPRCTSSRQ